ncbi:MAG TPA: hypothetical protein VMU15_17750 [Anaeromyxobacter sp.]|nr:hypothetical protein [Anaeromyxobacter sp.]
MNSAVRQLSLFRPARQERVAAAHRLADGLSARLLERVHLAVHDNRSTMVSFRRRAGVVHYRVHHMFLDAPEEVVSALAAFAGPRGGGAAHRRRAGERIDAYVRSHRQRITVAPPEHLQPRGRAHDLKAIFDRLNIAHFGGGVDARIGWGAVRLGRRRRTVKTGVYLEDARVIRIHPTLDRPEVPEFYVAAVVFHEMLHQAVPTVERNGRRVMHGREFRRRERGYPDHERARAWEARNLALLLSSPA